MANKQMKKNKLDNLLWVAGENRLCIKCKREPADYLSNYCRKCRRKNE